MNDTSHITFLQDLAVVMIAAAVVTLLFHIIRQPVVLGYLLAGLIIGPHTPPFPLIHDEHSIRTLSELGLILLMFSLGMHFSLRQLKRVGATAAIAAVLEILLMFWVGYEVGRFFGWRTMDSIFLGAMLSISSTTIIVKALGDLGKSKAKFAQIIFGILIIEDLLAIAMIALLSGVATTGELAAGEILRTTGRITIFLSVALVLGLIAVPPLLRVVGKYKSDEMLLITVLGLCFGVALLAVKLGYSVALGAFVIGTIVGEAREIGKIKLLTEPVRDMFSAIFFVAIGMMIDPKLLAEHWLPIVILTVAVVVGKVLTCSFGTFIAGHDTRTSLRVGMGLAQIGEFSFIIASLGLSLKVTSDFLYPIAVTVSAITTLFTPYLIQSADGMVAWFDRVAPKSFVAYLELYSRWVERIRGARSKPGRKLLWKWFGQMALNVAIVTGIFIAAAYAPPFIENWLPNLPQWLGGAKSLAWLGASVLGLPGVIAILRKLQAFALLLAEMSVNPNRAGKNAAAIRGIISRTVFITGIIVLGLWVLVVSSPFLTSLTALSVLLVIIGIVAGLFWRFFISIHAKAQVALRESLAENPPPSAHELPLPHVLKGAELEIVTLPPNCAAAGKLIRELALRTQTGASIVGIERPDATIINPSPEEELHSGDQLFLLGTREQLEAARASLCGEKTL